MLSIMLSVIMAMSVIIVPASVSAKGTKKVPNTYVAKSHTAEDSVKGIYLPNKNGTVYCSSDVFEDELYFQTAKKKYLLERGKTNENSKGTRVGDYYVRGEKVYYDFYINKNKNIIHEFRTIDLNGKNKKTLFSVSSKADYLDLLGGYGSGVIFYESSYNKKNGKYLNTVKMFRYKKIKTLFKFYSNSYNTNIEIFSGKIFYNNAKSYDIEKGKSTSYVTKGNYVTKNYMYYKNKNNNLKSLDKKGVRRIVAKNIYKFYSHNGSQGVLYSRLNSKKEEVFYQKTGAGKEYKLCSRNDVKNLVWQPKQTSCNVFFNTFYKDKVYFKVAVVEDKKIDGGIAVVELNYLVRIDAKGGTPKIYYKAPSGNDIDTYIFNDKFYYEPYDPYADMDSYDF